MAEVAKLYCCPTMGYHVEQRCSSGHDIFECGDNVIVERKDGSFGIIIHDGGTSSYDIQFCPWCGCSLVPGQKAQ